MSTKNLKPLKHVLVAALALGAIDANAGWIIQGPSTITVTPGQSGTSTYVFTPTGGPPDSGLIVSQTSSYQPIGTGVSLPIDPLAAIVQYLPVTSPVGDTVSATQPFEVLVAWTISSDPSFGGESFSANYGIDTDVYGSASAAQNFNFAPVALPEPGQTMAGALIMGGGCAVFAGRRWFKKKPTAV
jgi:hypothetical protein